MPFDRQCWRIESNAVLFSLAKFCSRKLFPSKGVAWRRTLTMLIRKKIYQAGVSQIAPANYPAQLQLLEIHLKNYLL
jgi:hypothetical protein